MPADTDICLKGNVHFAGSYDYGTSRVGFGDDTAPRAEDMFRLRNRHRLLFKYFQFEKDRRYALDDAVITAIPLSRPTASPRPRPAST